MDDAGSIDCKKQDLNIAQSAKDNSATGPLQNYQFELPVNCKDDVEMLSMPASPHDRDVMHKVRGYVTAPSQTAKSVDVGILEL